VGAAYLITTSGSGPANRTKPAKCVASLLPRCCQFCCHLNACPTTV
jgi:hypothetical protein